MIDAFPGPELPRFGPLRSPAVSGVLPTIALAPLAFAPNRKQRESTGVMKWAFLHALARRTGAGRAFDASGGAGLGLASDESELS
jgi:hypothetical protein